MKTTCFLCFLLLLFSCKHRQNTSYVTYGDIISEQDAADLPAIKTALNESDSIEAKFEGTIDEVCQMKGCWMTLKTEDGLPVRVTFKDYGFFVPKDASGRKVIVKGIITQNELDRADAEHYAEDAGKTLPPDAELMEVSVVASGVLIEKADQL